MGKHSFWLLLALAAAFGLGMLINGGVEPSETFETESFIEWKARCTTEGQVEILKHPPHGSGK